MSETELCPQALHKLAGDAAFPAEMESNNDSKKFSRMMRLKETHILALWTFLYVGIEVTVGGEPFILPSS